ncbi:hypothetical protein PHISCL_08766 [Aspergillus sclerotialis]|uniref:Short chain dehydrogenase n=1 Tax=Aspergillus sclerotialis TaxID=2070753 RepID=A0A3A2Z735_9EURO|nr:hypothetical protein PHISCL_08766 [Aspergillus sclerotialis]
MPKSVLITGCGGGIGSTLAKEFHAAGLHVYATTRSKAKMTHLEHLENITLLELDVVSQASIEAAVEIVRKETETLDILVNNAGQTICMPTLDVSIEEAKKIFDVNLWGVLAVTQAFAPMVIAAKGTIVNLCSISGVLYTPWLGLYNASKAALMAYSETLKLEMSPFEVKVISLVAGAVDTTIMSHGDLKLPENSLYKRAQKEIRDRGNGLGVPSKTPPVDFAKQVVKDILGGTNGPIWRGAMALVACICRNLCLFG